MIIIFIVEYFSKRNKYSINGATIFIILLLSGVSGLRGEMGVDYLAYKHAFENQLPFSDFLLHGKNIFFYGTFEPLYSFILSSFKSFSNNYNLFLFCQSFFLLIIVMKALRNIYAPINIGLILYFFFGYMDHFGQQRMAFIVALCILATTYIAKRNFIKFLFIIIIASFIQKIAIFYLPAYFIQYVNLKYFKSTNLIHKISKKLYLFDINQNLQSRKKIYNLRNHLLSSTVFLIISAYVSYNYNIAKLIYKNISFFAFDNPIIEVYINNFISYYQKEVINTNIFNAIGGITIYFLIIVFLYLYRNRWMSIYTVSIFKNYCIALVLFVLLYSIPNLSGRLMQLFYIPTFVFLFSIMSSRSKKPINVLPFIFTICLWKFVRGVTEIGPYVFCI